MLYRLSQEQLSRVLFPLGEMTKKEVRALAVKYDLPVKEKAESQEICFFGDRDYRDFLRRYLPEEYFQAGDIVDSKGNILGEHNGLINYTIGQRKGVEQSKKLKVKSKNCNSKLSNCHSELVSESQEKQPLYVIGYDIEKNQLIVGDDSEVFRDTMIVSDLIGCHPEQSEGSLKVKIRYRHEAVECRINKSKVKSKNCNSKVVNNNETMKQFNNLFVVFNEPQRAITPGQSAVFYDGEEVVGGGIIQ